MEEGGKQARGAQQPVTTTARGLSAPISAAQPDSDVADAIALSVCEKYRQLRHCRLQDDEATILAGIVALPEPDVKNVKPIVISLATGNKCLTPSKLTSSNGRLLHDCHAEVLCRRGFVRYCLSEIEHDGDSKVIDKSVKPYRIKDSVSLHMYISQAPCGDACIIPVEDQKFSDSTVESAVRVEGRGRKRCREGFTGAKAVDSVALEDRDHLQVGLLRTKPGRGERTTSMSCSDKLGMWRLVGLQGALLSLLMEPVYLGSVIVPGEKFIPSMRRALVDRLVGVPRTKPQAQFFCCTTRHEFVASHSKVSELRGIIPRYSPISHVWWSGKVDESSVETLCNGKRQGIGEKQWQRGKGESLLCKRSLFQAYLSAAVHSDSELYDRASNCETYYDVKQLATGYVRMKKEVRNHRLFENWSRLNGADTFLLKTTAADKGLVGTQIKQDKTT